MVVDETTPSVLLIETDNILSDLIQLSLEAAGYHVLVTNDVEEGLVLVKQHRYEVILLDLFLPGVNSLAFIRQLKGIMFKVEPVIIVLSAFGYREVVQQALEAGANDYLLKPIDSDALVEHVKKALAEKNTPQRKISKPNFRRIY